MPFEQLLASTSPKTASHGHGDAKNAGTDDKAASQDTATGSKSDSVKDKAGKTDVAQAKTTAKPDKDDKSDAADSTQGTAAADAPTPDMTALPAPAPQPQTEANTDTEQSVGEIAAAQGAKAAAPQDAKPDAAPQDGIDSGDAPGAAQQTAAAALGKPAPGTAKPPTKGDVKADASQGVKGAAHKAQASDAKIASAEDIKADAAKAAAQPAGGDAATKPAAQTTAQTADTNVTIGAPQTNAPANAPAITHHVQVSTQAAAPPPTPNMPALAVQIAAKSQGGARQFDIRLDPPELGRVEVRLSIDATGKASAHLSADQPQTLDLLQKDSTNLTRALREAGLDVSQDGLNFSLRQQGQQSDQGSGNAPGFSRGGHSLVASKTIDATAASVAYRAPADGRLDIRV